MVPQLAEHYDDPETLASKLDTLAQWLQESQYFTAFTGAGISTAAGASSYLLANSAFGITSTTYSRQHIAPHPPPAYGSPAAPVPQAGWGSLPSWWLPWSSVNAMHEMTGIHYRDPGFPRTQRGMDAQSQGTEHQVSPPRDAGGQSDQRCLSLNSAAERDADRAHPPYQCHRHKLDTVLLNATLTELTSLTNATDTSWIQCC